jgi:hypothetical protein
MNIHSEAAGEGYPERELQRNYNVNRVLFHRQSTYDKHIGRIGIVKMGKIIDKNKKIKKRGWSDSNIQTNVFSEVLFLVIIYSME